MPDAIRQQFDSVPETVRAVQRRIAELEARFQRVIGVGSLATSDLSDVAADSPVNRYILKYDGLTSQYVPSPDLTGLGYLTLEYRVDIPYDSTPASGFVSLDNLTPASTTTLSISDFQSGGNIDLTIIWESLSPGDRIRIQERGDPDNYAEWELDAFPTDQGGSHDISVDGSTALVGTNWGLSNKDRVAVFIHRDASEGLPYLPLTGGTLTGQLTVDANAPRIALDRNSSASGTSFLLFNTNGVSKGYIGHASTGGDFLYLTDLSGAMFIRSLQSGSYGAVTIQASDSSGVNRSRWVVSGNSGDMFWYDNAGNIFLFWDESVGDLELSADLNLQGNDAKDLGFLNYGGPVEVTISSGAITVTQTYHAVDTQSDAATDDLTDINGGNIGDVLILRPITSARNIVVKYDGNKIALNGAADVTLGSSRDSLSLIKLGTSLWQETGRSIL